MLLLIPTAVLCAHARPCWELLSWPWCWLTFQRHCFWGFIVSATVFPQSYLCAGDLTLCCHAWGHLSILNIYPELQTQGPASPPFKYLIDISKFTGHNQESSWLPFWLFLCLCPTLSCQSSLVNEREALQSFFSLSQRKIELAIAFLRRCFPVVTQ